MIKMIHKSLKRISDWRKKGGQMSQQKTFFSITKKKHILKVLLNKQKNNDLD